MEKLRTIKVLPTTVEYLNVISALTGEKQYEVADRVCLVEKNKAFKKASSKLSKPIK